MTLGLAQGTASGLLSAIFQGTGYSVTGLWVQLHVGDPGGAGTANPAGETTRQDGSACFGTAPGLSGSYMQIVNDADVTGWTSVSTSETYTHVSFWTLASGGTFISSGTISTSPVTAGDPYSIPAGDITARFPVAA